MTTAARLTYSSNPTQVAISTAGATSEVGITFVVANPGPGPVSVAQIVLTIPQGNGDTDLIAADTTFSAGSVRSSNGSSWSLGAAANQAVLVPVSAQGFATLAVGDTLQLALSGLQVNAVGAGQEATIAVVESLYDGGDGSARISILKIASGFYIESFCVDQVNVVSGSPVTVTWKVVDALSCSVTAQVIETASTAARNGAGCGIGTGNPACDGTIASGTDFSDSHTCNVQGATVFTLSAQGKDGNGDVTLSSQLLVTVNEPAINFTGFPPGPAKGQSVVLKWASADAGKLQLYTLPSTGQPGIRDITATPVGTTTVQPLVDTNYFLYAFTSAGDAQPAKQSEVDVTVEQPQWTANLAVADVPVPAYPGDVATLGWALVNVDHCGLACDQPGFAPQVNLPPAGPTQVTLPDPGVASATATFTLTPVLYGGLGNFTPQSTTVPITNLPCFSQALSANPAAMVPAGGPCTLTWVVTHADQAVLACNLPGATPLTVDPSIGSQVVQIPALVIPTPLSYTLTASRQQQKYVSTSGVQVQCTGAASVLWCRSVSSYAGNDEDYLGSLYFQHPDQRIRKIQLNWSDGYGVSGLLVWYSDAASPDYAPIVREVADKSLSLAIPDGDYINSLSTLFDLSATDDLQNIAMLWHIKLTTAGGLSIELGENNPDSPDGPYSVSIPDGDQAIALTWNADVGFAAVGLVSCTNSYGQ